MKTTKTLIKNTVIVLLRLVFNITYIIPIDNNKIVATSFYGRGFSDNPKAIIESLLRMNVKYEIIWPTRHNTNDLDFPEQIKPVRYGSFKHIYHLFSAKVWIDNCRKPSYIHKKNNQIYIQTWHGFPYKKIEADVELKLNKEYLRMAKNDSRMCNILVSNSTFMSKVYKDSFWYSGNIIECGSPRNDVLINNSLARSRGIRAKIGISSNRKVVLYAPTFRQDSLASVHDLDFNKMIEGLKKKFGGDWITLLRFHPNIANKTRDLLDKYPNVYDVTDYSDMQDILLITDVLITDYSSSMFDFIVSKKPCFIYAPDFKAYTNERDFYFNDDDLPFSISLTNKQLIRNIQDFNQNDLDSKCGYFMKRFGFFEKGEASKKVAQWLIKNA